MIRKTRLEKYTLFEPTGEVTYEEGATANVLWDLRSAKIAKNLSNQEIQKILRFVESHSQTRQAGKTAIVVSQDADYGVANIFLGYTMSFPITVQIFRDINEAANWITYESE